MIVLFSYYKLAWEPIVDQVAHSYSHRLPALGRKLRFWLFFHITGNPLNLESKLITFPWFSRVLQSKLEGNRWRGSRVMIGQTNKTDKQWVILLHIYKFLLLQRYQSTIPRWKSSSRGALSATSLDFSRSLPRSHSPGSNTTTTTMRKPIEPSVSSQHFHLPTRKKRMVYGRPGQKTGMTVLVNEMKARAPCRSRSPSMNNEEPIQVERTKGLLKGVLGRKFKANSLLFVRKAWNRYLIAFLLCLESVDYKFSETSEF